MSAHVIKQRGRWDSDVATIYQRPLLEDGTQGDHDQEAEAHRFPHE